MNFRGVKVGVAFEEEDDVEAEVLASEEVG